MVEPDKREHSGRALVSRIFETLSEKSEEVSNATGVSRLVESWRSLTDEEREQVLLFATTAVASIPVAMKVKGAVTRSVRRRRVRKNTRAVSGSPKKIVAARPDDDLPKTAKKKRDDDNAANTKKDKKDKKSKKDKKNKKDKKRKKDKKGKKRDKKRKK